MSTDTDLNELARDHMGQLLLVAVAALLMKLGFRLWSIIVPTHWAGLVVELHLYGTALALLGLAIADVDMDRWGHWIAGWVALEVIAAAAFIVLLRPGTRFGTDALLFSRYSVFLLLRQGLNPYAQSMAPAVDVFGQNILHITPQLDGSAITSLSYPGGMVVWFLPQGITGFGDTTFGATLLVAIAGVLLFLIFESPSAIALLPIIVMLAGRNLVWGSIGGLLDALWLLPLLVSMRYWKTRQYAYAAFAFGLAAGTKQTVWPIACFLAIWLYADADTLADFRDRASTCLAYGGLGFAALNLPFILANPTAWVYSVLTPIGGGAPMIHQGVGPTMLSITGVYALPKAYHSLLVVASFGAALGIYALLWDRLKWVAWITPPFLLFWYHRSLNSYFVYFLPVAYYAVLCALDLRRPSWPRPSLAKLREHFLEVNHEETA